MLVPDKRSLAEVFARLISSIAMPSVGTTLSLTLESGASSGWARGSGLTSEHGLLKAASISLLLLAQIVPLHARAEDLGGIEVTAVEKKACLPDVIRFCRPMMVDIMAVFGCMKQKRDQLSS